MLLRKIINNKDVKSPSWRLTQISGCKTFSAKPFFIYATGSKQLTLMYSKQSKLYSIILLAGNMIIYKLFVRLTLIT